MTSVTQTCGQLVCRVQEADTEQVEAGQGGDLVVPLAEVAVTVPLGLGDVEDLVHVGLHHGLVDQVPHHPQCNSVHCQHQQELGEHCDMKEAVNNQENDVHRFIFLKHFILHYHKCWMSQKCVFSDLSANKNFIF